MNQYSKYSLHNYHIEISILVVNIHTFKNLQNGITHISNKAHLIDLVRNILVFVFI